MAPPQDPDAGKMNPAHPLIPPSTAHAPPATLAELPAQPGQLAGPLEMRLKQLASAQRTEGGAARGIGKGNFAGTGAGRAAVSKSKGKRSVEPYAKRPSKTKRREATSTAAGRQDTQGTISAQGVASQTGGPANIANAQAPPNTGTTAPSPSIQPTPSTSDAASSTPRLNISGNRRGMAGLRGAERDAAIRRKKGITDEDLAQSLMEAANTPPHIETPAEKAERKQQKAAERAHDRMKLKYVQVCVAIRLGRHLDLGTIGLPGISITGVVDGKYQYEIAQQLRDDMMAFMRTDEHKRFSQKHARCKQDRPDEFQRLWDAHWEIVARNLPRSAA